MIYFKRCHHSIHFFIGWGTDNLTISISSGSSIVPNVQIGFRGMKWSDFTSCGNTTSGFSFQTQKVTCNKVIIKLNE